MSLEPFLQQPGSLSEEQMIEAMRLIMDGQAQDDELEKFLVELAERGESVSEITGAARVLREKALSLSAPEAALDCCGTGGDASGTYNISTTVAIVAASCGVPVAKHGNRAASSKSGAADVLEALGVNLDVSQEKLEEALKLFNFAFLMAPRHHAAMKHVSAVRKKLGRRTIFNLLGPLANPADTKLQLLGVYDKKWLRPMAEVLQRLGSKRAWIVHGSFGDSGGIDEISLTGPTYVVMMDQGEISEATLTPADFGLDICRPEDLKGGDAKENAAALKALLNGKTGAYRDIVLANAAVVLVIHGSAPDLKEGVKIAAQAIDSGAAAKVLQNYIEFTKGDSA